MKKENLNHCCKGTCSGWDDGYQEGIAAAIEALAKLKLESAAKKVKEMIAREKIVLSPSS